MAETIALRHFLGDEAKGFRPARDPVRLVHERACIRKRRDHQSVPVGKHLVVETRADSFGANRQELLSQAFQPRLVFLAAR